MERIRVFNFGEKFIFETNYRKLVNWEKTFEEIFETSTYRGWDGCYQVDSICDIDVILQKRIHSYAMKFQREEGLSASLRQIPSLVAILMCCNITNRNDGNGYIITLPELPEGKRIRAAQPIAELVCKGQMDFHIVGDIYDATKEDIYEVDPEWVENMYQ